MPQTKEERREAQRLAKQRSRAKAKENGVVEVDKRTNHDRNTYWTEYRRQVRHKLKNKLHY